MWLKFKDQFRCDVMREADINRGGQSICVASFLFFPGIPSSSPLQHIQCVKTHNIDHIYGYFIGGFAAQGQPFHFRAYGDGAAVQCASNEEQKSHKVLPDNLYNDFDFIRNMISPSRSRLSVPMIATAFKKKLFEISQK